jgi:hypothetical protein
MSRSNHALGGGEKNGRRRWSIVMSFNLSRVMAGGGREDGIHPPDV